MPLVDGTKLLAVLCVAWCGMLGGCTETHEATSGVMSGLRVSSVLGGDVASGYLIADGSHVFAFPRDHAAHAGYRSEWWYLTAVLRDGNGHEYGVQFTLFRQALAPRPTGAGPWHTAVAYMGHLAISDVARGEHVEAQRLARGHPQMAGVDGLPRLRAYIEDWSIESSGDGEFTLSARDADQQIDVQLQLTQQRPIVLQGEGGLSRKSAGSASYYYSLPRLQASGRLEIGTRSVKVSGLGWFDREWSTSVLTAEQAGWDWFALQLDDGRSVMAFRLRRRDGARDTFDRGMIVEPVSDSSSTFLTTDHPGVTELRPGTFELQPVRFWADERGVHWPVQWRLTVGAEQLTVTAMFDNQVMDTSVVYWEGIVALEDADGNSIGRGYMELTGYAGEDLDE